MVNKNSELVLEPCNGENVQILIEPKAWVKMRHIVDTCDKEAGWCGIVSRLSVGKFLIKDIYIPKQTVSGTSVHIEPEDYIAFLQDLDHKGIISLMDDENFYKEGLYFHGHSHVDFGVTPSSVDEKDMRETIEKNVPFYVWLIMNKKGECSSVVYINFKDEEGNSPYPMEGVLYRNVKVDFYVENIDEELAKVDADLKANLAEKKYTYVKTEGFKDFTYGSYSTSSRKKEELPAIKADVMEITSTAEDGVPILEESKEGFQYSLFDNLDYFEIEEAVVAGKVTLSELQKLRDTKVINDTEYNTLLWYMTKNATDKARQIEAWHASTIKGRKKKR